MTQGSDFSQYIKHGWVLVPILPGHKGPRTRGWNRRDNCITDPNFEMRSAGIAHAYSGTCAIDVDDYDRASEWLAERGVDLDALFSAPDSVQISSGRSNHGKLLYSLPEPLCSKKVALFGKNQSALDFRCATAAGLTVQDVLPPSIHPDTARPYEWFYPDELFGTWEDLPLIPKALHDIWLQELESSALRDDTPAKGASLDELRALLEYQDPSMNRDDWVKIGMAIHHETNGDLAGFELWDEWSQKSDKYVGRSDLENSWRSFHDTPNAVTVGSLRQEAVAAPDDFPETHEEDDVWAAAAAEKAARFKLMPVGAIARREPPEWIIDGLLPEVDLAMMFGPSGAGKSFLALDLAFSVATGITWFNRKVKPGPVVWIAAEAAGAMRNRSRAYAQARGVQLEATDLWVIEQTLSLMLKEDSDGVTQALAEAAPKLIIVDTLAAASGGANENSGEDMNTVLAACRRMHEATGALVLLIHHSGKDTSRGARGWSGLRAAVRTEFEIMHDPLSPIRSLTVSKQSDGIEGTRLPFKLLSVPLDFDDTTSCVVEPLDEAVVDAKSERTLGSVQRLVFKCAYGLASGPGEDMAEVDIQDLYDSATIEMPPPPRGKRDTRAMVIKRAIETLHERGYITVTGDKLTIGSPYDDSETPVP